MKVFAACANFRLSHRWTQIFTDQREKALPICVSSACRAVVRQLPDEGWCQSVASCRPISLLLSYPCHPSDPWCPFGCGSAALGNLWLRYFGAKEAFSAVRTKNAGHGSNKRFAQTLDVIGVTQLAHPSDLAPPRALDLCRCRVNDSPDA